MARIGAVNPVDIAASGLRAESVRLSVIARNIANARTSRTDAGTPYRRQQVVLRTDPAGLTGVRVEQVRPDLQTDLKRTYLPGHPDADDDGYVLMPNVSVPTEMMNMMVASRSYQANAAVLKRYQDTTNVALELLR